MRLWLIWPMAAVYGLIGGQPRTGWEWAEATFVAWLALLPPCMLGWVAAKVNGTPRPGALRRGAPTDPR